MLTDFPTLTASGTVRPHASCAPEPGTPIDMQVRLRGDNPTAAQFVNSVTPGRSFGYSMKPAPLGLLRSVREQTVLPGPGPATTHRISRSTAL